MVSRFLYSIVIGGALILATPGRAEMQIESSTPRVTLTQEQAAATTITLPALTFQIAVQPYCEEGRSPIMVSAAVADSFASSGADAEAPSARVEIELTVPADQAAILKISDVCESENPGQLIPGALTAQITTMCQGEATDSRLGIEHASEALNIELVCETAEDDGSGED